MTGAMSTRYIIHETLRQRRGGREYIYAKPYVRIVARLAPVPSGVADTIPPFNPFKLYANNRPIGAADEDSPATPAKTDVSVRVVELLGGILPGGRPGARHRRGRGARAKAELGDSESSGTPALEQRLSAADCRGRSAARSARTRRSRPRPNTTVIAKGAIRPTTTLDDIEGLKRVVKTVAEGQR